MRIRRGGFGWCTVAGVWIWRGWLGCRRTARGRIRRPLWAHGTHVVSHSAMAHVGHRQHRPAIEFRHRSSQAFAHGERARCEACPVHRLREDRERVLPGRLDDHVVRFRCRDPELVDGDRMHVLTVRRHDGHLQPGNPHVEVRHRRSVDESQAHALARLEEPCPIAGGRDAVHQIRVGVAGHVGEIRRVHPHLAPHLAIRERLLEALRANVPEEVSDRSLMEVVVVRALLQFRKHARRILVRPVREHDDVFAVVLEGRGSRASMTSGPYSPRCSWNPEWLWYQYVPACRTLKRYT